MKLRCKVDCNLCRDPGDFYYVLKELEIKSVNQSELLLKFDSFRLFRLFVKIDTHKADLYKFRSKIFESLIAFDHKFKENTYAIVYTLLQQLINIYDILSRLIVYYNGHIWNECEYAQSSIFIRLCEFVCKQIRTILEKCGFESDIFKEHVEELYLKPFQLVFKHLEQERHKLTDIDFLDTLVTYIFYLAEFYFYCTVNFDFYISNLSVIYIGPSFLYFKKTFEIDYVQFFIDIFTARFKNIVIKTSEYDILTKLQEYETETVKVCLM